MNESSCCSTSLLAFGVVIILDFSPFYLFEKIKSIYLFSGVSYVADLIFSAICHREGEMRTINILHMSHSPSCRGKA